MSRAVEFATHAADMAMKLSEVLTAAVEQLPKSERSKLNLAHQSNDAVLFWLRSFLVNDQAETPKEKA